MIMAPFCTSENVKNLKTAAKKNLIFKKSLETDVFNVILEILWNLRKKNGKCKDCFGKKTLKGLKKHKKVIKLLLESGKGVENRKKKFLKTKKVFRKWIKNLLNEFFMNCLSDEEEAE